MNRVCLILFIISPSLAIYIIDAAKQKRLVCYYDFPSVSKQLQPGDIDYTLCTHILIGFAGLENNKIVLSDNQKQTISDVLDAKQRFPDLKVMLSLGGGGGDYGFREMIANKTSRRQFVKSVEFVVNKFRLDGIDIDWEFPMNLFRNDKSRFTQLLKALRESSNKSRNKYIISIAAGTPIIIVSFSYDIPQINKLVDFVNLMCYDYNFYSFYTPWTAMNAPLYPRSNDGIYFNTQNINFSCHHWITKGLSKDKLNVGLPVYAHTYKLASPSNTSLGAPAVGDGQLGGGGSASYGDICDFIREQKLQYTFDYETKSPYVTNGSEWVSYENDVSLTVKTLYVNKKDFGGVMIYSISKDDYKGTCTGVPFPNTRIIRNILT